MKAERFKVKNVATREEKFLHLHYKEHVIPIKGGRGNLFNEELKVTPRPGGGTAALFCLTERDLVTSLLCLSRFEPLHCEGC